MNISVNELKKHIGLYGEESEYVDGYRVVFIYPDGNYVIGAYSPTIEGFMQSFIKHEPIENGNDIPIFISIDDLLNRYLNSSQNYYEVAIYHTNGNLIAKKRKE